MHLLGQLAQRLARVRPVDARAPHQRWTFCVRKRLGRLLDERGVPLRAPLRAIGRRQLQLLFLHPPEQDVRRDLKEDGAVAAGERRAERLCQVVRDAVRERDGRRPLGDRPHHLGVRQLLKRAHLVLGHAAPAADMQNGTLGTERGGNAGDGIGATGASRRYDATEPAGLARVAVGGVGSHLLVADVDDADALIEATIIDIDDVSAA